ncbi:peptidylprolyl isomerase [Candidatus Pacearchaeota archaeon]|nr:peptidylprolyl isomerase [Candidatus Pacearchaeota archaeon]
MKIKNNDTIVVEYEGKLETGEVFDSSRHGDHVHYLIFKVGNGQVIKGFDEAVVGMNKNEEKEIKLGKEEAYGDYKKELEKEIPKSQFPEPDKLVKGVMLVMGTPQGQFPVEVIDVKRESFVINLNHPLAGKALIFKIKVIDINPKDISKYEHQH